jgi:predicted nucleic-acid-binding Zn-ribbon protein
MNDPFKQYDDTLRQQRVPQCPLCGCQEFQKEEGRLDSKWGMTNHKLILLICQQCRLVMSFYDKRSIWDFD